VGGHCRRLHPDADGGSGGEEQHYFVPGIFPDVSKTGNWADVGHYTQMVWRTTTAVGGARATGGGNDVLVCRYSPPGNVIGEPVLLAMGGGERARSTPC
jgi:hypothetical protein